MKKVLIYGLYDWDNLGDDLMMYCVKNKLEENNITPYFVRSHNDNYFDESYRYENSLQTDKISNNKIKNAILKFWQVFTFNPNKNNYDSIIFMGGGYINRSIGSGYGKLIYILLLKRKFKKMNIFFTGQTSGPINNFIDRILLKQIYKKATVYVREKNSYCLLKKIGINSLLAGDDAFLLNYSGIKKTKKDYFIVNFKSFSGYDNLFNKFQHLIINVARQRKLKVILIPFRNIDSYDEYRIHVKLKKILEKEKIEVELFKSKKVDELISCINNSKFMIGTAYHFLTLGILLNKTIFTGYVGKYYKNKIQGIIDLTEYKNVRCYDLEKEDLSQMEKDALKEIKKDNSNKVESVKRDVSNEWDYVIKKIKEKV